MSTVRNLILKNSQSPGDIVRWLGAIRPLLKDWKDISQDNAAIPGLRSPYPIDLKMPEGVIFRGLQTVEIKLDTKRFLVNARTMPRAFDKIMREADSCALLWSGSRADNRKSVVVLGYRLKEKKYYATFYPGLTWRDPAKIRNEFQDFLTRMEADSTTVDVPGGIRFEAGQTSSIEVLALDAAAEPAHIWLNKDRSKRSQLLQAMLAFAAGPKFLIKTTELFCSFPFRPQFSDHDAKAALEILNELNLPARSAKLEIYCSVKSWRHIGALLDLKKLDSDGSAIEQCVASFLTPQGIAGWVVAEAGSKGLVTELHPMAVADEDAFVKELKLLLKEHLK